MPDIMIQGPVGQLEGKFQQHSDPKSPIALILHPHPVQGGTMNNKVAYTLFKTFFHHGFSTLRFNFRGVGQSEGSYDNGKGEISDAEAALDWLKKTCPQAQHIYVGGFSFGSWVMMQLLMKRPEIKRFVAISPPAGKYDFDFFVPSVPGQIIQGTKDEIVREEAVTALVSKINEQHNTMIHYKIIQDADHFFVGKLDQLSNHVGHYLNDSV